MLVAGSERMLIAFVGLYFTVLLLLCSLWVAPCAFGLAALAPSTRGSARPANCPKRRPAFCRKSRSSCPCTMKRRSLRACLRVLRASSIHAIGSEIQVLDDSSDETRHIASHVVEDLCASGFDAKYLRRKDRYGYKAGALDFGLKSARRRVNCNIRCRLCPATNFLIDVVGHFQRRLGWHGSDSLGPHESRVRLADSSAGVDARWPSSC